MQGFARLIEFGKDNQNKLISIWERGKYDLLAKLEKGHKFTYLEIASIAIDVAHALIILHELNIIHHDVKPCNMIEFDDGSYALIDFDLIAKEETFFEGIAGTLIYMSPEYYYDEDDSALKAIDIFALGCSLFELLQYKTPYDMMFEKLMNTSLEHSDQLDQITENKNIYSQGIKAIKETIEINPINDFILQMIAFEPKDRPTAHEVKHFFKSQRERNCA